MKIKIKKAKQTAINILQKNGFDKEVAELCVRNIIEGELVGKETHGLIRVQHLLNRKEKGTVETKANKLEKLKNTEQNLYLNSNFLPGFYSIYKSLEIAIPKAKKNKLFTVGIKDADITGYIGDYARFATEKDLIFIGFNNSPGGLVPFGAKSAAPWGTNPITVGVPTNNIPVVYDSAASKITWGDLMIARNFDSELDDSVAVNKSGSITSDPHKVVGLLPFFKHKGSGYAFIVELLGGALTGSRVGDQVKGGWGSFYILIDPTMFRPVDEFKQNIQTAIDELKSLPKAKGVKEIYYPGEQSGKLREKNLKQGSIEVDDELWSEIQDLAD